jgi:hypothetical protein
MPNTRSTRTVTAAIKSTPGAITTHSRCCTELLSLATLVTFSHAAEMQPAGHEANGFGRRYLHEHEAKDKALFDDDDDNDSGDYDVFYQRLGMQ